MKTLWVRASVMPAVRPGGACEYQGVSLPGRCRLDIHAVRAVLAGVVVLPVAHAVALDEGAVSEPVLGACLSQCAGE